MRRRDKAPKKRRRRRRERGKRSTQTGEEGEGGAHKQEEGGKCKNLIVKSKEFVDQS